LQKLLRFWRLEENKETKIMANDLLQRITIDPSICHGKPCVRGLRYPIEFLLELLSSGMSIEEILNDYDDLEYKDILATFQFAARLTQGLDKIGTEFNTELDKLNTKVDKPGNEIKQFNKEPNQSQKWGDRTWDVIKWVGAISARFSVCAAIALVGLVLRFAGTG
jgi:uncharacterized protein (DUF433 family)